MRLSFLAAKRLYSIVKDQYAQKNRISVNFDNCYFSSGAFADSTTGAATDNKVVYQAAKQSYRSAMDTYKAQVASSKAAREAAKLSAKASIAAAKLRMKR